MPEGLKSREPGEARVSENQFKKVLDYFQRPEGTYIGRVGVFRLMRGKDLELSPDEMDKAQPELDLFKGWSEEDMARFLETDRRVDDLERLMPKLKEALRIKGDENVLERFQEIYQYLPEDKK